MQSLSKLLDDILDISSIEAGKLRLIIAPFDLREVVNRIINSLQIIAREKDLNLVGDVEPALPKRVGGDEFRLGQVITNLVANAIKFTERGSVRVEVRRMKNPSIAAVAREDQHANTLSCDWIEFSVSDTGIGIAEERQSGLFRSFSQGDAANSRKYGGAGLGLAISKQLVELMGGQIGVESQSGVGSRFWCRLPLAAIPEASAAG